MVAVHTFIALLSSLVCLRVPPHQNDHEGQAVGISASIREIRNSNICLVTGYCEIIFVVFVSLSMQIPRWHLKLSHSGFL